MSKVLGMFFIAMAAGLVGCAGGTQVDEESNEMANQANIKKQPAADSLTVQTKESQAALTPDTALKLLLDGNKRYVENKASNVTRYRSQAEETSEGQYPFATILSCIDSRVSAEQIFDLNNGDAFNGRVAGNVASTEMLGSFEFATKLAGSKVIMVLGHTKCGAVKGACDNAKMGNLTPLLARITPVVDSIGSDWSEGEKNSKNAKFVQAVSEANVKSVKDDILKRSEVIKKLVDDGDLKIIGAMYDITTGKVTLLDS